MSSRYRIVKRKGSWYMEIYKGMKRSWCGLGPAREDWWVFSSIHGPIPFSTSEDAEAAAKSHANKPATEPDGTMREIVV